MSLASRVVPDTPWMLKGAVLRANTGVLVSSLTMGGKLHGPAGSPETLSVSPGQETLWFISQPPPC